MQPEANDMAEKRENASIVLKPITAECVGKYKAVRLAGLADTPTAFGSTYAKELLLMDEEWEKRASQWNNGEQSVAYLTWDEDQTCGIVAGFLKREDTTKATLVSMWVSPTKRRRGVGKMLVQRIIDWARQRGARQVRLMVTSNNEADVGFYERLGFKRTGVEEPYPNDPGLVEWEMVREIELVQAP